MEIIIIVKKNSTFYGNQVLVTSEMKLYIQNISNDSINNIYNKF